MEIDQSSLKDAKTQALDQFGFGVLVENNLHLKHYVYILILRSANNYGREKEGGTERSRYFRNRRTNCSKGLYFKQLLRRGAEKRNYVGGATELLNLTLTGPSY